ncbi:MAG: hypothetical protein NTV63_00815 [Candidatus Woesearchaeota archaeon]|nr:hypothetical protein [Candidatus Woesearchaeota archaeon]
MAEYESEFMKKREENERRGRELIKKSGLENLMGELETGMEIIKERTEKAKLLAEGICETMKNDYGKSGREMGTGLKKKYESCIKSLSEVSEAIKEAYSKISPLAEYMQSGFLEVGKALSEIRAPQPELFQDSTPKKMMENAELTKKGSEEKTAESIARAGELISKDREELESTRRKRDARIKQENEGNKKDN